MNQNPQRDSDSLLHDNLAGSSGEQSMSSTKGITAENVASNLTTKIFLGMLFGVLVGLIIRLLVVIFGFKMDFISTVFSIGGDAFIALMKLLIGPMVLVSLVCGINVVNDIKKIGKYGLKSVTLFIFTTIIGVILALFVAKFFNLGANLHLQSTVSQAQQSIPTFTQLIAAFIPSNLFIALYDTNVMQIIVFAILLGIVINNSGESGKRVATFFQDLNNVIMRFIVLLMKLAPYGVFCLMALLFIKLGFNVIFGLLGYFLTVLLVLILHVVIVYGFILKRAKLSPILFFKKLYSVIIFSFSVSSSVAAIPITMECLKNKLGLSNSVVAFVIPLGININKNGTAIMQAIAAIFIANAYQIDIGLVGNLMIVIMTVLISIGTAGAPGVGMVTLIMILKQLGLPLEGIALIFGVDRLLDMTRTVVNVVGNAMVTCLVAKSEQQINYNVYYRKNA
jgi:Na+/H+-dicarboxylate symporter